MGGYNYDYGEVRNSLTLSKKCNKCGTKIESSFNSSCSCGGQYVDIK